MVKRTGNTMAKHKSFVKKLAATFRAKEKASVDADATSGVKFVAHTEYAAKIRRAILAGEDVPKSCTGRAGGGITPSTSSEAC